MYQGLHEAVLLMQMDNGYCDLAGATAALHKLEKEVFLNTRGTILLAHVTTANEWCMANHGAVLETACTGEDKGAARTAEVGLCAIYWRAETGDVYVPESVHAVLCWLFDNM